MGWAAEAAAGKGGVCVCVIPYKWGLNTPAHTKTMSPVPPLGDVGAHVQ